MWRNIGKQCKHCMEDVYARPAKPDRNLVIRGFEPMEFKHADGTCRAEVYTICGKFELWEKSKDTAGV